MWPCVTTCILDILLPGPLDFTLAFDLWPSYSFRKGYSDTFDNYLVLARGSGNAPKGCCTRGAVVLHLRCNSAPPAPGGRSETLDTAKCIWAALCLI